MTQNIYKFNCFLLSTNDDTKFKIEYDTNGLGIKYKINNDVYIQFNIENELETVTLLWRHDDISKSLISYLMMIFDRIEVIKI